MKNNAITLISLVITIILLIILAGIGINLSLGENGLLNYAKTAVNGYIEEEKNEKNELDEIYSQILVAEDSKVTLTMEELKNYIDKRIEENSKKMFIDTSNIIENIGTGENELEYVATQDCAVVGSIIVYNDAYANIFINDKLIGSEYISASVQVNIPICYYLKKGEKIKITYTKNTSTSLAMYGNIIVYGIK